MQLNSVQHNSQTQWENKCHHVQSIFLVLFIIYCFQESKFKSREMFHCERKKKMEPICPTFHLAQYHHVDLIKLSVYLRQLTFSCQIVWNTLYAAECYTQCSYILFLLAEHQRHCVCSTQSMLVHYWSSSVFLAVRHFLLSLGSYIHTKLKKQNSQWHCHPPAPHFFFPTLCTVG